MTNKDKVQSEAARSERRAILTEECGEVVQTTQKIIRFGEVTEYTNNREHLEKECGDILAAISLMILAGDINLDKVLEAGATKINKLKGDESLTPKQDKDFMQDAFMVFDRSRYNLSLERHTDHFRLQFRNGRYEVFSTEYFGRDRLCWVPFSDIKPSALAAIASEVLLNPGFFPDEFVSLVQRKAANINNQTS